MRRLVLRTAVLVALSTILAPAGHAEMEGPHLTLTPYGGMAVWSDDFFLKDGLLIGGRLGAMLTPWLGVEGTYGFSNTETDNTLKVETDMQHLGVDAVINLFPSRRLTPYVVAGWSQLSYEQDAVDDESKSSDETYDGWEAGGGFKLRVAESDAIQADLRLDARDALTKRTPRYPDEDDDHHNLLVTAGIQIAFGSTGKDTDFDGIKDRKDFCPDTPLGAVVDEQGCPIDSDKDGVPDGLDLCPDTVKGARVDGSGCPTDADEDGVFDGLDKCDDTPSGALVDAVGCPKDTDGDGVFDGLDTCEETPRGATVDVSGCPKDSDGDGVFDGIDLCPNTPSGLRVDKDGCPIEVTETDIELFDTGMIRRSIKFESGSAEINPESFAVLNDIGRTLVQWPRLQIEIGGHTDSRGSEALNQKLSEERARSVFEYLRAQFANIEPGRFTTKGYGESHPIDTNDTMIGRANNRRVEFTVLNREEMKRAIERRKYLEKK